MSLNGTRFALRFPSLIVSLAFAWHGLSAVANAQEPAAAEPAKTPAAEAQPAEKPPGEAAPAEEPPPEAGPAEKAPAPPTPAEAQPAEKPPAPAARAEAAPVEKAPAEAPAKAEPEPAKPEEAKPDFSKLAEEEVAEGLKLTAEQHGRIAVLLAERNEALAAAEDEEAKTKILQQSDQKLADVLTEVQLADFLGKPVPKRLRLSFRYQLWEEVLQWLTDEAGWSLVIPTSPPPGTFNYTDPREYTPDEVLDLMNAVLIHQGYTLIRRDQMLMVISLERGIPEGVVPEVRLEDLPKRGKHELVTLRFDLGRRPADKVVAAIEPLLGPYGKATPIPTAAEILVTDTAGRMPSINEVIQSIAEPEPTPPTPKPESPRLEVYTIKVADPETVKGVLTQLLPSAQIAVDPKTGHLNVHATPSQQTVVQGVLEKMDTEAPAEKTRVLEVYPIDGFLDAGPAGAIGTRPRVVLATSAAAAQLLKTLQELVPEAQLSINEENKTLVAFATPGEQETIKQALEKLKVERAPEETPQLEVYRLTRVDPETTLNLLQELLPDARLAIDPQTRSLVAVAVPSDQGVIRSTLKILQPEEPGPDTPEPRFYELPLAMPPSLVDVIQKVAPGSLATMDAAGNRLMVVATPTQHTKIEKTIEHMKKTTFIEGRSKLVVYPVTPTQRKRFEAILTTLTPQLPGIQVIADGTPGELAIWAKPQQHDVIQEILDELKRDVPHEEKFQLVAYPIRSADPQSALEMLQTLFPETKLVLDPKAGRLMVWTSPSEQESVKAALEQIEAEAPEDQKPRFEAYPVYGIGAGPSAAGLLQGQMETLVPNARFTFDSVTTKLIAFATPEEHQLITSALAKLGRGGTAEAKPTVEVYPLTKAEPTSTLSLLQTLVPEAELSLGPQQGTLVAMASQEDHQTIKATLEKLQPAEPGPEAPEVRFYPLEQAAPANLLTVLQSRAPNAEITADPQREGLLVMASPADHKVIQAAVEQFKQAVPPEEEPQLKVYAVTPAQRARFESVQSTLAAELGDVKIVPGGRPNELCIWATPGDHKLITGLLEQMKEGLPAEGEYQLTAYPVKSADPANVLSMLQTLYPETQIVLDAQSRRLLVWTSPQEHASIKASLEQIEAELPPEEQPRFESYPIYGVGTAADLPTLVSTLQTLVPKAQITADTTGRRLIVWGTPEEHEKLQGAISNLGRGGSPETTPVITVYPLTKADPQSTVTLLQNLVPGAQINVDAETGSLVALAVPADQQLIKSTLEQLQPEEPGPNTPVLRLHPLKKEPPSNLVTALNGLVPKAQVTLDSENMQLMAVATLSDHEVIQKTIEEFEASAAERPELRFHLLVREPPADLLTILQGLVPKATVSLDVENKRLMAVATPEDHEIIRATVEEYEASTPPEEPSKLMVYTVTPAQRDRFEALLPNLAEDLPGVQIIAGGEPDELAIWARPTEQLVIADIIEQLKRDVPLKEQRKLVAYPVKSADPSSVLQVLQTLYPNTQFVLDPKSSRLMVWTRPEEHDSIKASLEEIEAGVSPEEQPRFEAFTLPVADTSTIVATLQPLVPNARLTIDTRTRQLIAWGTPTELEIVRKAVERLAVGKTSDFMPRLEVYPLTSADPTTAMTLLQSLVPDAEITLDAQSNRLIIRAVPSDHEVIKSTLAKIEGEGVVDSRPRFESYPILGLGTAADAQTFIATLQPLVPNARLTIDAKNKNLIAWGTPKEQEAIGKAVERLGQGGSPENRPTIEAYRLARADPQAALTLLENLVPDAQLSVDAQTGSVVALAVPDDHATIKAAVERIDAEAPAEEQPRFEAYPIRGITSATGASAFIAALQPLVPKAKLTLDAKYKNLIAWGTPKEHEAIRSAVERLGQGGTPETTPIVEVYRLTRASPATTLTLLQNLLPDAQLSVDSDTNNLVALAVPADQEVIKSTLDRLQPDKPGPDTPVLQFHPVRGEPSSNLVSVVQQMVPRAQITLDAENRCIMAVASPSDQQTIEATIRQFEIGAADLPQLRFHPLAETPPADLLTVLQQLAPRAQITVDSENKRVMAVASSDDHDKIRATIEQYELSTPPEEPGKLAVYSVTPAQRRRFEALLPTLSDELPDVQILGEGEPGELAVWATPTQHLLIQGIIDQIKQGAPDEAGNRLVAYPIKSADPQSVLTMLQRLFPDSDLVLDDKTDRLLAWTTPSEHERIKAALEAMDTGEPGDLTEQLIVYPISPDVDPTVAIQMLQQVVPEVQLLSDAKAGTIYAWARKADHQVIAEALEKMEAGQAEDRKPQLVVYPAGDIDSSTLAIMLSILVPQARVAVDSKTGGLAAYATPNDHEAIRAAIAEMAKEEVAAAKPTLETYSLESMTATAAIGVLSSAVPTARYSAGADAHQLLAWAKPSDHQMIQTILEQISREEPPETAPRLETYTLESVTAANAMQVLPLLAPEARFTPGTDPQQMIVWARPRDHRTIQRVVEQIAEKGAAGPVREIVVYNLDSITYPSASQILNLTVPEAQITPGPQPDQLIAWARPADHELVRRTLERVDVEAPDEGQAVIYTLEGMSPTGTSYALSFLTQAVPKARFTLGAQTGQIVAWAAPEEQQEIKSLVDQLTAEPPPAKKPVAKVYVLESITGTNARTVLQTAVPLATVTADTADPQRLTVLARPSEHETIAAILEEIDVKGPEDAEPGIYVLEGMSTRAVAFALRFLMGAVPEARFALGAEENQIVAWARPKVHEDIQKLVDDLTREPPPEKKRIAKVYTLESITTTSARVILQSAVPQATFPVDTADPQRLTALARPSEHETIAEILEEIDVEGPAGATATVKVYTVEGVTASSAYSMLYRMFPQARINLGTDPQQVVAWATPADHEKIQAVIEEMAAAAAEVDRTAQVYTLESITAASARSFLQLAVPQAQISQGSQPDQLIVWARQKDHATIAQMLKQIDVEGPEDAEPAVYVLEGMDTRGLALALRFLMSTIPEAEFAPGAEEGQIVAWARPRVHEDIRKLVDQLTQEPPPEKKPVAKVYTLKSITGTSARTVVQSAVPEATITPDTADPQRLTVLARPSEHETIAAILKEIDVEGPPESVAKVGVYPLVGMESRRALYALLFVRDAVPEANVTLSRDSTQLIAWARPKDHERIAELVEQLLREPPGLARSAKVYRLQWTTAERAMQFLGDAVPEAEFSVGEDPQALAVWARPADHQTIEDILKEIDVEEPRDTASRAQVYSLRWITAASAQQILETAVPDARFVEGSEPNQLVAWARPSDHDLIRQTLDEIDAEEPAATARNVVVYPLEGLTSQRTFYAWRFIREAVPQAELTLSSDYGQLIAWARPEDHKRIAQLLEQILHEPPETARRTEVYTLKWMTAANATRLLGDILPNAEFNVGDDPQQFVAWARPREHEVIQSTLSKIDVEPSPDTASQAVAYALKWVTAEEVIETLENALPDARFNVGEDPQRLVAWARPSDHEAIRQILDQIDQRGSPESEPSAAAYTLESASMTDAMRVLRDAVPQAKLTMGAEPHQLIAWARPADHEIIQEVLKKIAERGPSELAAKVVVYTLEGETDAEAAIRFLEAAVPEAEFSEGSDPRRLIAWARPADHDVIAKAVKEMSQREPPETAPRVVTYTLKTANAQTAMQILEQAVPDAQLAVGTDKRQLIAWARPDDHQIITEVVERLSEEEPEETRPRFEVYDVESTGAANALEMLQAALPDARLGVGTDPGKLVAWARPEDHKLIKDAVEQFEADSWLAGNRIMSVYPIKAGDAQSLLKVLDPVLRDHAQFVVDSNRNSLIVWAEPKYHEAVNKTVQEFVEGLEGTQAMTSRVYRFKTADPSAAFSVLQTLVPSAQLALDQNNQSIVASALPEDHERIQATVDEMDREDVEGQQPVLRVHRVTTGDVYDVYRTLTLLFRNDPTVQLSTDPANDTLIAIASAAKHDKIDDIIKEVEKGYQLDSAATLELYSMKNIDESSALQILNELLDRRGVRVDLSIEPRTNQLIAIARPEQHDLIRRTLEQLRTEQPGLEIYDLEYVDPLSAEMAIADEFQEEGLNAPQISIDPVTQQLFVRATEEQHQQIRKLLIKMGESKLALLRDRTTEAMRTIPFQGDLEEALSEIQRIWPQLRENPIRIVTPSAVIPPPKKTEQKAPTPAEPSPKPEAKPEAPKEPPAKPSPKPEEKPAETKPAEPAPQESAPAKPEAKPKPSPGADAGWNEVRWRFASMQLGSPAEEGRSEAPGQPGTGQPSEAKTDESPAGQQESSGGREPDSPPPLYVVPGEGTVTIVCDDPEALDQFEDLLRTLYPRTTTVGRNISVFELKHTRAAVVAEKLQEMFRSSAFGFRRGIGVVTIVPDERLNTILVQGSRIDRETVESLLRVFDSDRVPEMLASQKPQIIPIKNVDAEEIAGVIRDVFRSQMTPPATRRSSADAGARRSSSLIAPEIAVDEATNALVVMAPSPLLEEIVQLANTLDDAAAENPARRVKIIPLKKTDAGRVERALERILSNPSSRRRR